VIYTRRATLAWAVFFWTMALVCLLLGIYASLEFWSLFTNFIAWALVAGMFVGEYLLRKRLLRDHVDYGFLEFIRNLTSVDFRHVLK